jgi:SAM-dependent methyltransferase
MHVLEELARERKLLSPDTREPVRIEGQSVISPSGRPLGQLPGPLNFLAAAATEVDPAQVPAKEVERLREHLKLPGGPDVQAEIAKAIAWTGARIDSGHLSAEARMLAERFRIPEFELEPREGSPGSDRAHGRIGASIRGEGRPSLAPVRHTIGGRLTAGREVWRSVRVRNGAAWLPAAGASAARIEARWTAPDGSPLEAATRSTPLPVELEPGRLLTVILKLRVPDVLGACRLALHLVAPGASPAPFATHEVHVGLLDLPVFEHEYYPVQNDYQTDHRIATEELQAFVRGRYPGRRCTLLEIGGGVHPQSWVLAHDGHCVVSTDISHSQTILGALYFRFAMPALAERFAFMSCDGAQLPFADGSLDGIVLFAAFHHFDDPGAFLAEMRRVIRDEGFVYIANDCCAPDPAGEDYLQELRRGINEQMWTLPEYQALFRDAGLEVARARVDVHDLKVFLVKARRY